MKFDQTPDADLTYSAFGFPSIDRAMSVEVRHSAPAGHMTLPMPATSAGFTLIELMMVVTVISVLAAIAYPSYQDSVRKAKRTEARAAIQQLMETQERYYSVKNTYLAFNKTNITAAASGSDLTRFKWYSSDNSASSSYEVSGGVCAAPGSALNSCIKIVAKQNSANVKRFLDPVCGDLSLQSDGVKTPSTPGCW